MRKLSLILLLLFSTIFIFTHTSCNNDGRGVNIFSVEDDIQLGMQLNQEIMSMPEKYPVVERSQYPEAYSYLDDIVNDILATGELKYAEEFPWEVHIIAEDTTLNAFAAPGGYIYVYTGMIKFLNEKDDFVGVMGHEMAHADLRHSTQQLTQQYGIAVLLELLVGNNPGLLANVLGSLVTLKFSRDDEEQADRYSVIYLCDTQYAANGAASFFEKLVDQGVTTPPVFLSTHPNPGNRVEAINMEAQERGCDTTYDSNGQAWENFQASALGVN